MSFQAGSYVWIPDKEEVVIPAKVDVTFSPGGAGTVTRLDNNRTVKLSGAETKDLTQMHEQSIEGVEDMVEFKELDEFSILYNLRMRFDQDIIYTNIGRILTSVNPFKFLEIYSPMVMDEYMEKGSRKMPPHVYGVADDAFSAMIDNGKSQSCIVSGESGAGKTEATKVFLQYISEKSKRQSAGNAKNESKGLEMQQKILESNPLMEAFGNAKTVRNDNSSRFGKWIEVQFDTQNGQIAGGNIKSYLLEKSRIVSQANNERNYHIFYQFCAAGDVDPALKKYNISDASQYYYLNQSEDPCTVVKSIDDKQEWLATMNAMARVGITNEEKHEVLNIISIVLNVGNVGFTGTGEEAAVENMKQVADCAELLGCSPEDLERALIKIDRSTSRDPDLVGNLDVSQACDARDAFAKYIYALLFDWLIGKINDSLGVVPTGEKIKTIGVLDIFGFEFFENNSFEQLCINYCNETLQGHFNDHVFKLEQTQYQKEGIDVTKIDFADNLHVINTIDAKGTGVLQVIAEQLKIKTATDETLLNKLKGMADEPVEAGKEVLGYPSPKEIAKNKDLERVFTVNHYAGCVSYRIDNFLEKNRDAVPTLLTKLGKKCKNKFISNLFSGAEETKKQALGLRFSGQLKDLMGDLEVTEPHFIRCVKPNSDKVSDMFTSDMVLAQLRYAGLLEVCRIRQMGYPVRRDFKEFYSRYRFLVKEPVKDHTQLIAALGNKGYFTEAQLQVGNSKVFMKTAVADKLEEERATSLSLWVRKMQRVVRGHLVRIYSREWSKSRQDLRAAIKSRDKNMLKGALLNFGSLPYGGKHLIEYKEAKELLNRIEDEERIAKMLTDAMRSRDKDQIEAALKAAEKKELGGTVQAKEARHLLELIEKENACKQDLRAALDSKDEQKLHAAVKLAKDLNIGNDVLCKDAESLIKAIEKEKLCRKNLEAALKSGDVNKIKMFMNQMADIGKADDPLVKQGEAIVKEKAKAAAEIQARKEALIFGLQKAIATRNLQALETLEGEVINLGISNETTKQAHEMKTLLIKERDVCAKLNAEATAAKTKGQTRAGITADDLAGLEAAIAEAGEILPPDDFQLLSANEDLDDLKKQLKVQEDLEEILAEYKQKKTALGKEKDAQKKTDLENELLKMLREANDMAVDSGAETEATFEIKEKLNQLRLEIDQRHEAERELQRQEAVRKMQETTEDEVDVANAKREEQYAKAADHSVQVNNKKILTEAANNQRYNVNKYYRLRTDEDYVEKLPNDQKLAAAKTKMISQSKPIVKSLCRMDRKENDVAIRINKAILQYCGDLNVNFPATLAQFVLIKGLEDASMTDEIFLQLIKHINGNPKADSQDRAWLLMCMATKTFPPPDEFVPYLLNFFIGKKTASGLIGNYARLCVVQLDATLELGPTFFKPNIEEIQNYRKRPPILASINLLGGDVFDYPVTPDMRVSQVLDILKAREKIADTDDHAVWGIYVSPEEEEDRQDPRERLIKFYQHYNPSKIAHVDLFLDHWRDNAEELFQKLVFKYGPEPAEEEKTKKRGMLALPITAAMNAVKFLGFAAQKEQPPAPQTPWPLPWWTFLGDVFYRMSKQKKVPRFTFKRRMITRVEPVDMSLYLQAVQDVSNGYLPIENANVVAKLAAIALTCHHGADIVTRATSIPALRDIGVESFIPNFMIMSGTSDQVIVEVLNILGSKQLPAEKQALMEEYIAEVRKNPVYGMNYFYARHSASEKNYVIAVDIDGIHVLETDRTKVKRSFVFDTIKKFGATAEYFWMNIDERQEPEKSTSKFKFLVPDKGINVLLYTLQSWEMYDCVYDATHLGMEEEESQIE